MFNKIHEILKDPQCNPNIKALGFTMSVTMFYLCALIFGLNWLESTWDKKDLEVRMMKFENNYISHVLDRKEFEQWKTKQTGVIKDLQELKNNIMPAALIGRK